MPAESSFINFLHEQFSPLGEITSRRMFGGYCLYCDGVVFGLVANSQLFLKADEMNRGAFENRQLPPFKPFDNQDVVMQYYEAPPEIYEDPEAMRRWCGGAVDAGRRARMKTKGTRKKRANALS